jgi:hypothetical protein
MEVGCVGVSRDRLPRYSQVELLLPPAGFRPGGDAPPVCKEGTTLSFENVNSSLLD